MLLDISIILVLYIILCNIPGGYTNIRNVYDNVTASTVQPMVTKTN